MSRKREHDKIPSELLKLIERVEADGHREDGHRAALRREVADALSRSWRAGYSCGHATKRYHAKRESELPPKGRNMRPAVKRLLSKGQ